jgi:hypothetical protein
MKTHSTIVVRFQDQIGKRPARQRLHVPASPSAVSLGACRNQLIRHSTLAGIRLTDINERASWLRSRSAFSSSPGDFVKSWAISELWLCWARFFAVVEAAIS